MRKLIYLLITFLSLFFCNGAFAQSSEKIEFFQSNITINLDGTINVQELIKYDFGTQQRHGIIRTIPLIKTNTDGEKLKMDLDVLRVLNEAGEEVKYSVDESNGELNIKIGDPNITVTGSMLYAIEYKVSGALTYFSDHDELYWNVTGNDWNVPIEQARTFIQFPKEINVVYASAVCYSGAYSSSESNCTVLTESSDIENSLFIFSENLMPFEGLTVSVSFPPGVVAELEPEKYYPIHPVLIIGLLILGFLYFLVLPIVLFIIYLRDRNYVNKNAKILTAWFDPPKNNDLTPFTPEETAYLVDNTAKNEHITAQIVSLAREGYIKINVDEKNKVSFTVSDKDTSGLSKDHKLLINSMQKSGKINQGSLKKMILGQSEEEKNIIDMTELQNSTSFGNTITSIKKSLPAKLENKGLYNKSLLRNKNLIIFLAILGLSTFNFLLAIALALIAKRYKGFTPLGIEKYSEAMSLKNFLISQDEKLDFQADKQMFFEKLLPYATAFGVEDVWYKRFEGLNIVNPDWYTSANNTFAVGRVTNGLNSAASSAVRTTTRSSSGFSSGSSGGFSGGGGGGGGGRSW